MMKKFIVIMIAASLWQCRPDIPEGPIGKSYDLTAGIEGEWQIDQVLITDHSLPVPETREISDFYTDMEQPLGLSFDTEDKTYMVINPSAPANPFGNAGTFQYNDPKYPSGITFYTDENDTVNVSLTNMVRAIDNHMGYRITKTACDQVYASYQFIFNRK